MDINNYFAAKWFEDHLAKRREPKKYLLWIDDLRSIPNHYINNYFAIFRRSIHNIQILS